MPEVGSVQGWPWGQEPGDRVSAGMQPGPELAAAAARRHYGSGSVGPGLPGRRSVCLWQMAVYSSALFDSPLGPSERLRVSPFPLPREHVRPL